MNDVGSASANVSSLDAPDQLSAAVLFVVFNRPDATEQVFEAIKSAKPSRLYVAADGPRGGHPEDAGLCASVRLSATAVDWPCEVFTLFRKENLGCKAAVSSAITWFFETEEEGIILEDDCLPSQSFFRFCEALLRRYRHDTRVWQVCGSTFVPASSAFKRETSYLFSSYGPIWGWASWRRAWAHYDPDMRNWQEMKNPLWLDAAYPDEVEKKAKVELGDRLARGEIDTWDYQWGYCKNFQSALSIIPAYNLVENIGFRPDATHTTTGNAPTGGRCELQFPLRHPRYVLRDIEHDRQFRRLTWASKRASWISRVLRMFNRLSLGDRNLT